MYEVMEGSTNGLCANVVKLLKGTLQTCIANLHESVRGVKGGKVKNEYLFKRLKADKDAKLFASGMRPSTKSPVEKLQELKQREEDYLLDDSPTHGTPRVTVTDSAEQGYKVNIDYSSTYSAEEIIPVLAKAPKGVKVDLMKNLIEKGAVPVKKACLYKHIADFVKTGKVKPWSMGGRPSLTVDDMKEMKSTLIPEGAHIACTTEEFEDALDKMQRKKFEERHGWAPAMVHGFCKRTVSYYRRLFQHVNNLDEGKALFLTDSRATAQFSMRNAVSYALTIVEACFVEHPQGLLCAAQRKTGDGNITAKDLYANRRGFIIANELKISIDDTTVVLGLDKRNDQLCLFEHGTDGKHTAISKRTGAKPFADIMRVTMTVAFNGVGRSAVPFVAVQVSEKELPTLTNASGFFPIRVPGLTMQAHITGSRVEPGFLVFCRAKGDDDEEGSSTITVRAKYFVENVLLPWVKQERQQLKPTSQDDDVLPELTALVMVDGQQQQLAALMADYMQATFEERRIILEKLSAGATATEQGADVSPSFKVFKTAVRDVWAEFCVDNNGAYGLTVSDVLSAVRSNGVSLTKGKVKMLEKFLHVLPSALFRAFTPKNVAQGFTVTGIVSEQENDGTPDLGKLLGTCQRRVSSFEHSQVMTAIPTLHKIVCEKGSIAETDFDELGIEIDQTKDGRPAVRNDGAHISHQRAVIITHEAQRQQRTAEREMAISRVAEAAAREVTKATQIEQGSAEAERKLAELKTKATVTDNTLEHFNKLNMDQLHAFCTKRKWPEANQDEQVSGILRDLKRLKKAELAQVACELRGKPAHPFRKEAAQAAAAPPPPPPPLQLLRDPGVILQQRGLRGKDTPSELVMDTAFRWKYKKYFDVSTHNAHGTRGAAARQGPGEIDLAALAALASTADRVMPHVRERLQRHIERTVSDRLKRLHWVWDFVEYNLCTSVALMALAGHFKVDQNVCGHRDALLVNNPGAFKEITPLFVGTLRGAYLYANIVESRFVRSGKAVSIVKRVGEHAKAAEHPNATNSRFYLSYPAMGAVQRNPQLGDARIRKGWFESLRAVIALAYLNEHGPQVVEMFTWTDGGVCQKLKAWRPTHDELEKKKMLVDYLLELVYELALSPADDVSSNPGFETLLNIYDNADKENIAPK
jgi:hypothetical protein